MELDPVVLSRIQFALTVMFHYLFPPLTIGLGAVLVGIESLWVWTGDRRYEAMARFWTRIFAINFAMGVATGIVMEFEFGTNWAHYSRYVGDVFGSALAAEGIFAFFLESGFLSVLVFGWDRVGRGLHFFATVMVFVGSVFSSVWIVVANSWMQTPAGHHVVDGVLGPRAEIVDFWAMVFNPSSVERLLHVWAGSFALGGFFVTSIAAWYLLRGRHLFFARRTFLVGLSVATLAAWGSLLTGHDAGSVVAEHQPAKLAAFEGHYETGPAPLWLWGWPDDEAETVRFGVAVPGGLSLLVYGDADAPVRGLREVPPSDRPPTALVFQTYHGMLTLGVGFLALTTVAWAFALRGTLFEQRWLLWVFVFAVLGAYAANQLGWASAEIGRQPWIVHGLLRTGDAVSESVGGGMVLSSIAMFGAVYALLFAVWVYVMNAKIQHGPDDLADAPPPRTDARGLVEVVARFVDPAGPGLTGGRDDP